MRSMPGIYYPFCSINCKQRPQYKRMKPFSRPAETGKLKIDFSFAEYLSKATSNEANGMCMNGQTDCRLQ